MGRAAEGPPSNDTRGLERHTRVHGGTSQPKSKPQTECPQGGHPQGARGQCVGTGWAAMCPIAMLSALGSGVLPAYFRHSPYAKAQGTCIHNHLGSPCTRYTCSTVSALAKPSHRRAWPDSGADAQLHDRARLQTPYLLHVLLRLQMCASYSAPHKPSCCESSSSDVSAPGTVPFAVVDADPPAPVLLTPPRGGQV